MVGFKLGVGKVIIVTSIMKKNLFIVLILIFFSQLSVGWSADFNKGLAAAQKGDFANALR